MYIYDLEKTRWKSDAFRVTRFRKPETTMGRWQQMQLICIPFLKMWEIHSVLKGRCDSGWSWSKVSIKGTVSRDFYFRFFPWIIFLLAPENNTRVISNFFKNLRRYSQVKVHHHCQRHQWQTLAPVPLVLLIPVANLPPVSTRPAAHLPPVSMTPMAICHPYQRHRRQVCHWCQRHRWQTMGTISDCWQFKVNLKEKFNLYANSTSRRCPKERMKTFLIEDFFHLPPGHRWCTLSCEYLREFSKKF